MDMKHRPPFCDESPIDCHFEVKNYQKEEMVHNDDTKSTI